MNNTEKQIANDLDLCDLGILLTTGKLQRKYIKHRKACFKALRELNEQDGMGQMTDAELLEELSK
jgi:hypothetical protein